MSLFGTPTAMRRLEEDVRALRNEIADIRSDNKRLGLEWEELYDKVRRQMGRMSKRIAVDAANNGGDEPLEGDSATSDGLDPISRSIMARRGMAGRGQ